MIKKLVVGIAVVLGLAMGVLLFQVAGSGVRYGVQVLILNESDRDAPLHARQVSPLGTFDQRNSALKNGGRCDLHFVITSDDVPSEILIMTTDDKVLGKYHIGEAQDMTFHLTIPREERNSKKAVK